MDIGHQRRRSRLRKIISGRQTGTLEKKTREKDIDAPISLLLLIVASKVEDIET
jgi:hypothetical protein